MFFFSDKGQNACLRRVILGSQCVLSLSCVTGMVYQLSQGQQQTFSCINTLKHLHLFCLFCSTLNYARFHLKNHRKISLANGRSLSVAQNSRYIDLVRLVGGRFLFILPKNNKFNDAPMSLLFLKSKHFQELLRRVRIPSGSSRKNCFFKKLAARKRRRLSVVKCIFRKINNCFRHISGSTLRDTRLKELFVDTKNALRSRTCLSMDLDTSIGRRGVTICFQLPQ